jgi:hypothetical protein
MFVIQMTRAELATRLGLPDENQLELLESRGNADIVMAEQVLLRDSGLTLDNFSEILEELSHFNNESYAKNVENIAGNVANIREEFQTEIRILAQQINELHSTFATTDHQLRSMVNRRLAESVPIRDS